MTEDNAPGDGGENRVSEAELMTESDLLELDAQYEPFKSFGEWRAVDTSDVDIFLARIGRMVMLEDLDDGGGLEEANRVVTRIAAVETGAIVDLYEGDRGVTMSVALEKPDWQTTMRAHDERMPDLFKAHLEAYELASEAAADREPITEKWIRELHEVLTAPQATYRALTTTGWTEVPLKKGKYKEYPNHVKTGDGAYHSYAPVDQT